MKKKSRVKPLSFADVMKIAYEAPRATKRLPPILRNLPYQPKPFKTKWAIEAQYIIDRKGGAVAQWQSYTTRANAKLMASAPEMKAEIERLKAEIQALKKKRRA